MGDAEDALPQSKKRAAGRELSRDNPGLDDEEEASEQEAGTFKRASEEVLANRRIVKVRRHQTSSAPPALSSNPFAGIRLVPPTSSGATTPDVTVETESGKNVSGEVDGKDDLNTESEKEKDEKSDSVNEANKPELLDEKAIEGDKTENGDNKVPEGKKTEKEDNKNSGAENTEKVADGGSFSSFQQLSSNQNAFTGLSGTGFSSSTFSFGLKDDQPSYPSFGFGPSNNGSSLFGTPSIGTKSEGSGVPSMQEVHVETGEENEKAVFTADSVLFEFLDGGWKERGKGELKVNVSTTGNGKARLVMRARGNYRLILNASLYADMKLTNMEKKGITFACMNSTSEGKEGLCTFAVKFRDASIVEEFRTVVTENKGKSGGVLKTPENSPKASDD